MVNRIGGLASGMDIDAMVAKLMKAERMPMDKLFQKKQIAEWQRDAYRSINTKLKTFSDFSFDNILLSSNFLKKTASVSGGSSDKVSIKAGAGAAGNLEIQSVTKLASNAKTGVMNVSDTTHRLATADDTLSAIGVSEGGSIKFKVTDDKGNVTEKEITFTTSDKISDFVKRMNEEGLKDAKFNATTGRIFAGNNVEVASQTNAEKLGFSKKGESTAQFVAGGGNSAKSNTLLGELGLEDGSLTFNVIQSNGETKQTKISYSKSDTIESFINNLNRSGAGVTALFSNGKLTIGANNSGKTSDGSTSSIQVLKDGDGDGNDDANVSALLGKLGFGAAETGHTKDNSVATFDLTNVVDNGVRVGQEGENAIYKINGLDMESASNLVNVSGYEITLKGEFTESTANTVSVKSTHDIDHMVDKIKEFVNKYNELIGGINDQLKETKYRSFAPLTDEQRKDMSENEQKLWDEKAKSGLLRSDSLLRQGMSDIRYAIGGHVGGFGDGAYNALSAMGITTTSNYSDGGKLQIDENQLRKALTEDPERVISTLTQQGEKKSDGTDTRGIVQRLRSAITDFSQSIEKKAGRATMTDQQYALGKELVGINQRMDTWKTKLENIEARYWKQFSAMEKAINKANEQSSMFAQFAGGN